MGVRLPSAFAASINACGTPGIDAPAPALAPPPPLLQAERTIANAASDAAIRTVVFLVVKVASPLVEVTDSSRRSGACRIAGTGAISSPPTAIARVVTVPHPEEPGRSACQSRAFHCRRQGVSRVWSIRPSVVAVARARAGAG